MHGHDSMDHRLHRARHDGSAVLGRLDPRLVMSAAAAQRSDAECGTIFLRQDRGSRNPYSSNEGRGFCFESDTIESI